MTHETVASDEIHMHGTTATARARGSLAALADHLSATGAPVVIAMRLRQVYIRTGHDDVLLATFDQALLELVMYEKDGSRLEGRGIAVIGRSGAGKSMSITRLIKRHPVFAEHGINKRDGRALSVRCRGSCTLRVLGELLLKASGYEIEENLRENKVWQMLQVRIEMLGILVVHVDEVNNLIENGNKDDHQRVINNFKGLINNPDWPVLLVISGTDMIEPVLSNDAQLRRRVDWLEMRNLEAPGDNGTLGGYVEALCRIAGVAPPEDLEQAIAPRLVHAACMQIGIAAEIAVKAVEGAIGMNELSVEHFATAYARRTGCGAEQNPFVRVDYLATDPTIAIVAKPARDEDDPDEPRPRRRRRRKAR